MSRKIITSFVYPPIPIRTCDWCAYLDGYEPGNKIGWGSTEEEAMDDLLEQLEDSMEEWEIEEIEMRQKERHLNGECEGLPECGFCCDQRDEEKEKEKEDAERYGDIEQSYTGKIRRWVRK